MRPASSDDDEGMASLGRAGTKGVAVGDGFLAVGGKDFRIIEDGQRGRARKWTGRGGVFEGRKVSEGVFCSVGIRAVWI